MRTKKLNGSITYELLEDVLSVVGGIGEGKKFLILNWVEERNGIKSCLELAAINGVSMATAKKIEFAFKAYYYNI